MSITKPRVLVTGASGFIASRIVTDLLLKGYNVRAATRSGSNPRLRYLHEVMTAHPETADKLDLVETDLLDAKSWNSHVKNCKYVLHTASPVNFAPLDVERDLYQPAIQGTMNILEASARNDVEKIIITSSSSAITDSGFEEREYDENDWTDPSISPFPYSRSKTLAEKAVWKFAIAHENIQISTICPSLVLGPSLVSGDFTSGRTISDLLTGKRKFLPDAKIGVVDIRDVSASHIAIMEAKHTANERYICSSRTAWFKEIADILACEYEPLGWKVTTRVGSKDEMEYSDDPSMQRWAKVAGLNKNLSNTKIREKTGIKFRPIKDAVLSMAKSLIEREMVTKE